MKTLPLLAALVATLLPLPSEAQPASYGAATRDQLPPDGQARLLFDFMEAWPVATSGPLAPPETPGERALRLSTIAHEARALAAAHPPRIAPQPSLRPRHQRARAFALLVLTGSESGGWDPRVHAGLPHPVWTQDNGRAKCLGQLHQNDWLTPDLWQQTVGTDAAATHTCLWATLRLLEGQMRWCRVGYSEEGLAVAYAAYGNGGRCVPTQESRARAAKWTRAMATGRP